MRPQTVFVSATPGPWEMARTGGVFIEQVIRPTGLIDPECIVRPVESQVDDLMAECRTCAERGLRVLVTTLTKRMAEDLTEYLHENGIRVRYLHSDIDTLERIEIVRDLRLGVFDVLVGINLSARGPGHPRMRPGRDPRCRQGGLSALADLADPDHRPRRAQHRGPGDPLCRPHDRLARDRARRRPSGGAPSRPPTTRRTASRPRASRSRSATSWRTSPSATTSRSTSARTRRARSPAWTCRAISAELEARMKDAAGNLEFEEAARLRDEIRRLEASELGVRTAPTRAPGDARRAAAREGPRTAARGRSAWPRQGASALPADVERGLLRAIADGAAKRLLAPGAALRYIEALQAG